VDAPALVAVLEVVRMKIKISALLVNREDKGEVVCVLDYDAPKTVTVETFVAGIMRDGGIFLNDQKTDWVPFTRILRIWKA
jgi:hypothetical protein